jgi:hypothetical protein
METQRTITDPNTIGQIAQEATIALDKIQGVLADFGKLRDLIIQAAPTGSVAEVQKTLEETLNTTAPLESEITPTEE